MVRYYLNTVWGHIIYRPIEKPAWKLPYGMRTLEDFIEWHEKTFAITQSRSDHPLALEVYFSIVLERTLTKAEIAGITAELTGELVGEFFGTIAEFMEWGYDYETVREEMKDEYESMKRYSRNGEDFVEKDLTEEMSHIKDRLK